MQITRKILTALLLLPFVVLSAQDMDTLTDGMGRILTDGFGRILVSSGPVSYPNDATPSYTIFAQWDFEDRTLGVFDVDSFQNYFYQSDNSSAWMDGDSIVMDEINGVATKVYQIEQESGQIDRGVQGKSFLANTQISGRTAADKSEVYFTYNFKFGENFAVAGNGKLPNIMHTPDPGVNDCPDDDEGFWDGLLFKDGNRISDFYYEHSAGHPGEGGFCPTSSDQFTPFWAYDSIWPNNGTWYNLTERCVLNTFTTGVANADGISEVWIDGRMIYQRDDIMWVHDDGEDSIFINGLSIGTWYSGTAPPRDCYVFLDNFTTYMPTDDSIIGSELHAPHSVLPTPVEITDRANFYDHSVTTETTISTAGYPSVLPLSSDETWLVTAGGGETVTFTFSVGQMGGSDVLLFYDGPDSDSEMLYKNEGYDADLSDNGPVSSTGQELFIRISTDESAGFAKFTGSTTFN